MIREVKQAQIRLNLLIGLKGIKSIKYKNLFFEKKVSKWSIETNTRLIREVKRTQIRLNLLIGLRRITVKSIFYTKFNKMITAITRSVLLKSERFLLFVNCRETQHRALVKRKFIPKKAFLGHICG